MSKEGNLAKNTAIISISKICTQFISFFLLPLYTSILSISEYGTVDLLISYSSLLLPIVTLAVEQAIFRYLIDIRMEEEKKAVVISTSLLFTFFQAIICMTILYIVQLFIHNSYMPLFILMVLVSILSATMLQLNRGLGDNIGYALGSFCIAVVQILCNILYLVVLKLGVNGMLLATATGNLACFLLLFCRTKIYRYIKFKNFDIATLKEMLKYSIPLVPNQLSWWIMNASDKTIIAIFLGSMSNGLLAVSHKFPNMYIQFNNIFNVSWSESATLYINEDDAEEFFTKIVNTVFKLFACANISIIVCIPFIIDWLVDPSYYDAYYQIPIFMLASLCNVVVSLYGVIYVAHKKTKEIAQTAFYAALINAGTHLFLVHFIGLYAASISSLLGYGVMAVYRYFHSRKYLVIKFTNSTLYMVAFMIILATVTYYLRNMLLHIITFLVILIMSIIMNKKMIQTGLFIAKNILKIGNWES